MLKMLTKEANNTLLQRWRADRYVLPSGVVRNLETLISRQLLLFVALH